MSVSMQQADNNPEMVIATVGCLDTVENNAIRGWVYSRSDKPVEIKLLVDGRECAVLVEWKRRPDVAERYGEAAMMSGFSVSPVETELDLVQLSHSETALLEVVCDGTPLKWSNGKETLLEKNSSGPVCTTTIVGSYIDSVKDFTIKGWVIVHGKDDWIVDVAVNGQRMDCPCIRLERTDVAKVFGEHALGSGFEIEVPGFIWEAVGESGLCEITLTVEGVDLNTDPILIDKSEIVAWIERVTQKPLAEEGEYLSLLALEHVKYGNVYEALTESTRRFLQEVASRTQLKEYLEPEIAADDEEGAPVESVSSIILREAMYELNSALDDTSGEAFSKIKALYKRYSFKGEAKAWYLNLAVQLTCASDEFDKLGELTDFHYLDTLQNSKQPHQLALLLPVLVSNGEVEKAAEILHQISRYIENSWLPTECLLYSVKLVNRKESEGCVGIHDAEHFRMGFVTVLDGFKAEWFSRLHDENLVRAMVVLLSELNFYTDYHKRDIIKAAIRIYGLCPVFWRMVAELGSTVLDGWLAEPQAKWQQISDALANYHKVTGESLMAALCALDYFAAKGNQEVQNFVRDMVVNADGKRIEGEHLAPALLHRLLNNEHTDLLRLIAHPRCGASDHEISSSVNVKDIHYLLRGLGVSHKSAVYDLQLSVSKDLEELRYLSAAGDCERSESSINNVIREMERKAILLGTLQGMFLGVDVLIAAYQISVHSGCRHVSLLMNAMEMIRIAVEECGAGDTLAPPVCAAIRRIAAMQSDMNMVCVAREVGWLIRSKFGNRYDWLSEIDVDREELTLSHTWPPQDTLVLIETNTRELDGNCRLIKETWIKDLNDRGVPYLFVTGGGDGERDNDVLSLNVPEGRSWDVERMLKTYQWVLRNTDAQYVVKVNDKCLLGVQAFFDSLCYRKHHYYGKIVRCSQGKMDRRWHHRVMTRSTSSEKCLDKSPSIAGFVSGDFACSLSRFAVKELCEVTESVRGKRLIGRAYSADKLTAELLITKNITPSDEDFDIYSDDIVSHEIAPKDLHGNSFLPGKLSPCKIARAGSHSMLDIHQKIESSELWPKKIWPTYQKPSLRGNSNQLELITDCIDANSLLQEKLVVVSVVRNEMVMLPQFLEYYRRLGVKCFIFVDNCSDDGTREYLQEETDTILYSTDTEYKHSHYGVAWQQAILGNHCLGKWVLLADADEFLVYEGSEHLPLDKFIENAERDGGNGVLLYMIDMYPYGDLNDANFEKNSVFEVAPYFDKDALTELRFGGGMYSNSSNYVNGFRHRLAPSRINAYVSQKYALFKYFPWVRLCEGVHYAANMNVSNEKAFFAHFKYHAGFKAKVTDEVKRKQHYNGAEEYKKYEEMLIEQSGGFGQEGISERYQDSHSFVRLAQRLNR